MCKASEFEIVNPCELPTSISPGIETVKVQPCVISDLFPFQTIAIRTGAPSAFILALSHIGCALELF